jgi:hypothetical protein
MMDFSRMRWFVAILSLMMALSAPAMAVACAGGGGEEEAGIDLTPDKYFYPKLESKAFTVRNYGLSRTISSITVSSSDYSINDPNGCNGKKLGFLSSCQFSVTGSPSADGAVLTVTAKNSSGQTDAWDASPLNMM